MNALPMSTKPYKYVGLILLLHCAVFSNECSIVFGRNDEVIGVKAANISMREEVIVITLRKDYYEVDVTFDFFNSGAEENIQLGFPVEVVYFYNNEVYDFKSYVNGKAIPLQRTITDSLPKFLYDRGGKGTLWFIRNATFPANSRIVSRVTYKAKYNQCDEPAGYIYGTGRYWKGGIGKMTVVINHGDDVLIRDVSFVGNSGGGKYQGAFFGSVNAKSSKFTWEADGKYKYVFENVSPKSDDEQIVINVRRFESGLYGEYRGHFGVHPEERWADYLDICCDWPWSVDLLYTNPTDIRHYTKNQVRLFINFFFAKHGYDFKNSLYREYFPKIKSFAFYTGDIDQNENKRYKVNPNFKESDFNDIERKNIDYLLKLEKMIPNL